MLQIRVLRLAHGADLPLPAYETAGAAGLDLRAALAGGETVLPAGRHGLVPTGLSMQIPEGFEGQVRPRSGLALRAGVTVLNAPGTVDSDYRGEIKVILVNLGSDDFLIRHGDRIAQFVVAPVSRATLLEVEGLDETGRGEGGFGSTSVAGGSRAGGGAR